ncbi:MAG: translocation/assembly module TamB domain-containing protein [Acidobacteria bacterium]|nr:translocation/assembly module TamB domain-containing protein [Acidobacteriota bacterium]
MNLITRLRRHPVPRAAKYFVASVAALLAAALVASLTVDLGPAARSAAERGGSDYLERPIHIGSLGIRLLTGRFVVENLTIDGFHPGDRPFFTAKRIDIGLDWLPAFRLKPDFVISTVSMTDWQMLVEKWESGHNFPKFVHEDSQPKKPRPFTVTLRDLHAYRGQFAFEDHEAPWSIVCPNLDITIGNVPNYHGRAAFSGGIVRIQDFVPMWTNMKKADFVIDGPHIRLSEIDFDTDGAKTVARGEVDFSNWPNQFYNVQSRVNFPRMRQLFFKDETWDLTGDGDFTGTFRLTKGKGHDLSGRFTSALAGVNAYRFPSLYGSLHWTPQAFDVSNAGSKFSGGDAKFSYSIKPLGRRDTRPVHHFDSTIADLDLQQFTDFQQMPGLRFAGAASLHNVLEWPAGRFAEHRGDGHLVVTPQPGQMPRGPMTASLAAARQADPDHARHEWGPFAPVPLPAHLPVSGELTYRYSPDEVAIDAGRFATEKTHVTFDGTTAWGDRSRLPFHVTSSDWQESDQVLVGIIQDFGASAHVVPFGGRGEFDGVMTGAFKRPRIEGTFSGEDLRGFDTLWGGLFSLGYPRDDGGEEMNARIRVARHDVDSLRHAFGIDDYPVSGLLSGDFHLTGEYERPVGFGSMTIDEGVAYGEPFERATTTLRFDGMGARLDTVSIAKSGGTITGAAFVGWDSTYSFNGRGRHLPVERLALFASTSVPLTGIAEFEAEGSGTFDVPRFDVTFRVNDLFYAEEGIGQVTGKLARRGKELNGDVNAASPRLTVTGGGRITLSPQSEADLTFRFHDTSLDPYVRLFVPTLSPFTTAVASGSIRAAGDLANIDRLVVDGAVDALDLRLFDYAVKNAAPVRLRLEHRQVTLDELRLVGEDTRLRLSGAVSLADERIALRAAGDANLGVLQGFFRNVRASGHATVTAAINGPLRQPQLSGSATITDGRVRHFSLPNALDAVNGTVQFDSGGIRLDGVSATLGRGRVQFGGRIGMDGYQIGDVDVTVRGEGMQLRWPEGIRSVVDADLSVRGSVKSPTLGGTVNVKSAVWNRRIDTPGNIFDFASRSDAAGGGGGGARGPAREVDAPASPLRFDIQILVPSTLRVENNLVRMTANADLTLRGTYDRPVILGRADLERGEATFEGRRYRLTRGSIDFTNPGKIEPFFDIEAETNVRVAGIGATGSTSGQTYRVTVTASGTSDRMRWTATSDPALPASDVLALLFSDVRRSPDVELRTLQNPNQTETDILTARATQALAAPLSSEVGKVVEQAFGVDTFALTPSLVDPYGSFSSSQASRLNPTARLTIGKRISDRVFVTFSRSLGTTINDQILILEIEQSDTSSWIISRNEDSQTYAIELRKRYVF